MIIGPSLQLLHPLVTPVENYVGDVVTAVGSMAVHWYKQQLNHGIIQN